MNLSLASMKLDRRQLRFSSPCYRLCGTESPTWVERSVMVLSNRLMRFSPSNSLEGLLYLNEISSVQFPLENKPPIRDGPPHCLAMAVAGEWEFIGHSSFSVLQSLAEILVEAGAHSVISDRCPMPFVSFVPSVWRTHASALLWSRDPTRRMAECPANGGAAPTIFDGKAVADSAAASAAASARSTGRTGRPAAPAPPPPPRRADPLAAPTPPPPPAQAQAQAQGPAPEPWAPAGSVAAAVAAAAARAGRAPNPVEMVLATSDVERSTVVQPVFVDRLCGMDYAMPMPMRWI